MNEPYYFQRMSSRKRLPYGALTQRRSKRRRAPSTVIIKAKGETKYDDYVVSMVSGVANVSLPTSVPQGDGQGQRIGSKLRILSVEVRYDLTDAIVNARGCAMRLVIPKDPSATPPNPEVYQTIDPTSNVLFHEEYANPGTNMCGMFRWKGPLNVEFLGDT